MDLIRIFRNPPNTGNQMRKPASWDTPYHMTIWFQISKTAAKKKNLEAKTLFNEMKEKLRGGHFTMKMEMENKRKAEKNVTIFFGN